ncbi:MAG: hypothetical protein CL878_01235, partial [Dehalococcoidia bacterium]|nr:hypothetical protein [Dehalococcoidia bacterium]
STDNVIFSLQLAGLVPVLAHPERNAMLQEQPTRLHEFVERGVLAQVTAQSIVGALGSAVQGTAELFLSCGLAHVIASDTHRADTRPPGLASAVEQAARICGPRFALAMVEDIPRRLLADQVLTFEPPAEPVPTRSWFGEATGMLRKALSGP